MRWAITGGLGRGQDSGKLLGWCQFVGSVLTYLPVERKAELDNADGMGWMDAETWRSWVGGSLENDTVIASGGHRSG